MNTPDKRIQRRRFLRQMAAGSLLILVPGRAAALGPGGESQFFRSKAAIEDDTEPVLTFGLVTDTHYADLDDNLRPRFFRAALGNIAETVGLFNREQVDFAVHLGDVVDGEGTAATTPEWLARVDAEFRKLNCDMHYVPGNHDLWNLSKEEFLELTCGKIKETSYHFDDEGWRFIVMDANFRANGTPYRRGNYSWTDTNIPQPQLDWIEERLNEARSAGMRAIMFVHQTLDDTQLDHRIRNAPAIRELFERAGNVAAVFYGHRHPGGYFNINGIPYVGIVSTVEGRNKAAAIVRVMPDGSIEIEGKGRRQPTWGPFPSPK